LSLGLERILVVMAERNMYPDSLVSVDVALAAVDDSQLDRALTLAQALRRAGLRVDLSPKAQSPGKLRKQADDDGIAAAVWIEGEVSRGASLWLRAGGETQHGLDADALTQRVLSALGRER
jgi:histidyl-tRNA synthetase